MLFHLTLVAKSKSEVAFKESADSDLDLALRGESGDPNTRQPRLRGKSTIGNNNNTAVRTTASTTTKRNSSNNNK